MKRMNTIWRALGRAGVLLLLAGSTATVSAKTEAIFTSNAGCYVQNQNHYNAKTDVYVRIKDFDAGDYAV